jgi:plasmid stabilization system protein ParE
MTPEKCAKIIRLVKDARSIAADLLFSPSSHAAVPKALLLALLYRIQAVAVSLQADLLAPSGHTERIEGPSLARAESAEQSPPPPAARPPKAGSRCQVIPFDRRRLKQDRRRIPTYIARDRRSGVVDRRARRRSQRALL